MQNKLVLTCGNAHLFSQKSRKKIGEDEMKAEDVEESMLRGYIYHCPIRQEETGAH